MHLRRSTKRHPTSPHKKPFGRARVGFVHRRFAVVSGTGLSAFSMWRLEWASAFRFASGTNQGASNGQWLRMPVEGMFGCDEVETGNCHWNRLEFRGSAGRPRGSSPFHNTSRCARGRERRGHARVATFIAAHANSSEAKAASTRDRHQCALFSADPC